MIFSTPSPHSPLGRLRSTILSAPVLLALLAIFALSGPARAREPVDVYTGAEWDTGEQSFYYLGLSGARPLSPGLKLAGKVFTGYLTYRFEEAGEELEATTPIITPAVGLRLERPGYALSGFLGADYRNIKRERPGGGEDESSETGLSVQGELYAWGDKHKSLSVIASYSTIDDFVWSRARAKRGVYGFGGDTHLVAGLEVGGSGNSDFSSFQAGGVVELLNTSTTLSVLLKAGAKTSSSFGGAVYYGLELYRSF